jgi:uncharacterized protein GlcG (DUF336 family)
MTSLTPTITPYGNSIPLESAKRVLAAAEKEAEKQGWPMVIAIVDTAGLLVTLSRHDQAQKGSIEVAIEKAKTAALFRRSTKVFQDSVAGGGAGIRMLGLPGATPVEGGLPILKDNQVIGGIGVSGMASDQDAAVATAGLAAL